MSHPDPRHDPENVRSEDSKFAPKAKSKALSKARDKYIFGHNKPPKRIYNKIQKEGKYYV